MTSIETKGGQIFEMFSSRKEALEWIGYYDFDNMPDDDSIFVQYKDGTIFAAGFNGGAEGTYKKFNIKTVIIDNGSTTQLWGAYRLYNMDNTDEEYSEVNDDECKCWNADET